MSKRTRFSVVHGVSDRAGMPRIGKIKLGEKRKTGGGKEYPAELDYFRFVPDEGLLADQRAMIHDRVARVYGERPHTLTNVFFPSDEIGFVCPSALEAWVRKQAGGALWCTGDGQRAERINWDTGAWEQRACCHVETCPVMEKGDCKLTSRLRIFLPEITMAGYWQIDTSSQASTGNVNDVVNHLQRMFGRLTSIPLVLSREPKAMTFEGKTTTHYILHIRVPNVDLGEFRALVSRSQFVLEAPEVVPIEADIPDELVPASVQEPEPDADLLQKIAEGFDILGLNQANRLVSLEKWKADLPGLLEEVKRRISARDAANKSREAVSA